MNYILEPLKREAPLMMNMSEGNQAYQCHQYVHDNGLSYILVSYKDKQNLIHWAHYVRHEDNFIGQFAEGICPDRKDYEFLIADINKHIREQYPTHPSARLYKSKIRYTILKD